MSHHFRRTIFNINGKKFRGVEIRLSGGVEGWASREKGSRSIYFTDGPDFVFAQSDSPARVPTCPRRGTNPRLATV